MRKYIYKILAAFVIGGISISSAYAFEELGKIKLEPFDNFQHEPVGTVVHWLKDGEPFSYETVSIEDNIATGRNSEGCEYTYTVGIFEGPVKSWKNCGDSSGAYGGHKTKGSPWPMKVKKKWSYAARGASNGSDWKESRKCKVKSAVRVKVPAGEFDTFKIICKAGWQTRTIWYAPEIGQKVAVKRKHNENGKKSYFRELVRIDFPG